MNPGDVVMLKSGGPKMTVESVTSTGAVHVAWFSGDILLTNSFGSATLVPVDLDPVDPIAGPPPEES